MTQSDTGTKGGKKPPKAGSQPRSIATRLLTRVVDDKRNLDALCDESNGLDVYLSLDPRDRALARAIATTTLRHLTPIDRVLQKVVDRKPPAKARLLIHTLQTAIAQILFMEVPDSAAVNLAVDAIANDRRTGRFKGLANAVLRRVVREKPKYLELVESSTILPGWMAKQLRSDFGKENMTKIARMVAFEPALDLTVKREPERWAKELDGDILKQGTVRVRNKQSVRSLPGFDEGAWWVQDAAASLPARLLGEVAGKSVLDLCAAPGGKAAQLISFGAEVTALDISRSRLDRLEENLRRLNMTAEIIEADILNWEPETQFDAVLIDAPCSSTGTLRRHPDVMWTKSAQDIRELAKLQFDLVMKAKSFVKSGGTLVFANCSMFKEEGEDNLVKLIEQAPDLEFKPLSTDEYPFLETMVNGQGAVRSLPFHLPDTPENHGGMDGFFACRFEKQ